MPGKLWTLKHMHAACVCATECTMLGNVFVYLSLLISNEMVRSTLSLTFGCWKSKGRGSIWTNFAKSKFGSFWFFGLKFLKSADQKLWFRLSLHTISLIVIYSNYFSTFILWWWTLKVCVSETDFWTENVKFWHYFWAFWKLMIFC